MIPQESDVPSHALQGAPTAGVPKIPVVALEGLPQIELLRFDARMHQAMQFAFDVDQKFMATLGSRATLQGPSARSTPRTKVRKAEKVEPLRWLVVLAGNPRSYPPQRDEPRLLGRQFESERA